MYGLIMKAVWMALKTAYGYGLRKLIVEAINDPDSDWDETAMGFLDRVFDYETSKTGKK